MKNLTIFSVLVALFTLVSINVNAQTASASANATGSATIIAPIQISKTVDMSFGNIVAGAGSGTVVLATNDSRSKTGDVILPAATPGTIASAQFKVTGLANATYAITLPTTLNISNGSQSMTINSFTSTPSSTGTLTSGEETVKVGATLNVGASQASGNYTGSFSVTVAYN